jgi:hypothetical protein
VFLSESEKVKKFWVLLTVSRILREGSYYLWEPVSQIILERREKKMWNHHYYYYYYYSILKNGGSRFPPNYTVSRATRQNS